MDETIHVILKLLFDFALEVWFSIYYISKMCTTFCFNFDKFKPSCVFRSQTVITTTSS